LHDSCILLFLLGVRCPNFFSLASSARGRLSLSVMLRLSFEKTWPFSGDVVATIGVTT
jgi:hypothetical protein